MLEENPDLLHEVVQYRRAVERDNQLTPAERAARNKAIIAASNEKHRDRDSLIRKVFGQ